MSIFIILLAVRFCLEVQVTKIIKKNEHNRLNVGRIALERLVGALNQLQPASVGGGGGGGGRGEEGEEGEPKWD